MTQKFFPTLDPSTSVAEAEKRISTFWKDFDIFKRSIESRSKSKTFNFFDGPPFATGLPHYGHILTGTIKDVVPRYWTMKGYRVPRKWGWDCHGVPVEFQVEKEHDIGGKPGIEAMGVAEFNGLCRSIVLRCANDWKSTIDRMGRFIDTEDDYKTMDPEFMQSVWWVFSELNKKGLIYEGEKVVPYSPKLGSPLSNFEANLNYKPSDDPALTVKFELESGESVLAWTTTPWTLPSNLALCVSPKLTYQKVINKTDNSVFIAGELFVQNFIEKHLAECEKKNQDIEFETGSILSGIDLIGQKYKPLFPFFHKQKKAFQILGDDFVTADSGTGIVHMAPNFGEDDARVCKENDIAYLSPNPIDENGYFTQAMGGLAGLYFRGDNEVKDSKETNANKWVIAELKAQNIIFKQEQIRHDYPFCWRTDCALMYRGIKTWFVDVQKIKARMIELNENINWSPSHLKHGRFGNILETAPDWAISRNRYWGTPMPVWKCDKTGEIQVINSKAELEKITGKTYDDLHKHIMDDVVWENPETGGTMRRIPEVFDCWMESGSMPYASMGYPFANPRIKNNKFGLIRHAQSENNVEGLYNTDPEKTELYGLTKNGKVQAGNIKEDFDIILCSPFRRARETAQIIASHCEAEVIIDNRLREIYLKKFEGGAALDLSDHDKDDDFEGGESLQMCTDRAVECLLEYDQKHEDKRIGVVTHGGPIEGLMQWYNKKDLRWQGMAKCPQNATCHWLEPQEVEDFPAAQFIAEGLDQTRCWFYVLHVLGTALWDKNIYQNVVTNGIVLAEDGQKMSKSKQNYPDPNLMFDKYGADSMRLYLMQSPVVKGENLRFAENGVEEMLKNIILPLRNAYQFLETYATIDGWKPTKLTFMRHGEAEHNIAKIYSSTIENQHHLTPKGKKQAQDLALKNKGFDQLMASPLLRTQETAAIIAEAQGLNFQSDERIREIDFGNLEGTSWLPIPERLNNHTTEKLEDTQARVESFIKDIAQQYNGQHVGVVAHASPIRSAFTGHLFGHKSLNKHVEYPHLHTGESHVLFPLPESDHELDRWIISELQTLIDQYRDDFEAYNLDQVTRAFAPFIDKLNNWYLRRSRTRFWAPGLDKEKNQAYQTLHYVLLNLSKLLAPLAPFFAEQLYQNLVGDHERSVHLEFLPMANQKLVDKDLETRMQLTRDIVGLAAGIRARNTIKLRQPLSKLQFCTNKKVELDLNIIAGEANVKEVEIIDDLSEVAEKMVKIDASKVGRKFGKKVQSMIMAGKEGRFEMYEDGRIKVEDEILETNEYETSFTCKEGVQADNNAEVVVLIETEITEDLRQEGLAREIIRAIQDFRKSSGFEIADRIIITYETEETSLLSVFETFKTMIASETLSVEIKRGSSKHKSIIDSIEIGLSIEKA